MGKGTENGAGTNSKRLEVLRPRLRSKRGTFTRIREVCKRLKRTSIFTSFMVELILDQSIKVQDRLSDEQ